MKPEPTTNQERRFFSAGIEIRAEENAKPRIAGYAAKFNVESEPLGRSGRQFVETIAPGAFDDVLQNDVRALFNHDPNIVLARSKNGEGTLSLSTDETGLRYEFDAPDTQAGRDLIENIRLGNVDQSSFGFTVAKDDQKWEERQTESGDSLLVRTINKVSRLFDVSPVTYPAYPDATVALRSLDESRTNEEPQTPSQEELTEIDDWAVKIGLPTQPA